MEQRLQQRMDQFQRALARLEDACTQPENEFIRDAVIQRFEFTFELAWKMLKQRLSSEGLEANSPAQSIRQSIAAGLLDNGNQWTQMQKTRNLTSHTYDETMAQQVYSFVCKQALPLFRQLAETSRKW